MSVATSSDWPVVTLDLEDESLTPSSQDEALRLASAAERGTLGATGVAGDCVQLEFVGEYALVLYMAADQKILRPHFPHRSESGEGIEEFFCSCCGVQLGDKAAMVRKCMPRDEAMRVCRTIFHGQLPDAVPPAAAPSSPLEGMEEIAKDEARWRAIEWRPLQPRASSA